MSEPSDENVPADERDAPGEPAAADPFAGPDWAPSADAPREPRTDAAGRVRVRTRVNRRKRRRNRRIRRAFYVVAGLLLIGAAWLVVTALLARTQLDRARTDAHTIRADIASGDLSGARAAARRFSSEASRAHSLTSGPAWAIAAAVPGLGTPLDVTRVVTASLDRIGSSALPTLVDASSTLRPSSLRGPDGSIDLAPIERVRHPLAVAAATVTDATRSIAHSGSSTWLDSVDSARADLLTQLGSIGHTLDNASAAAQVLPTMLGQHGTQRYFVAFQNDAEARGTGGLPGAFAIATATDGHISFERFESDGALDGVAVHENYGPAYAYLYRGMNTTSDYRNTNLSPNFPYAAQTWSDMWQQKSGEHIDGAIALDPEALSYLLAVTGPATLPDGTQVSSQNVVALTQNTVYFKYRTQNAKRKQFLLDVAKAASDKILDPSASATSLVHALAEAAGQRRFLVWSRDPSVEARLARTSVAGQIPRTTRPYVGLSIVNDGGNKLDYYLSRSITWARSGCGSTREVTVTIRLTNNAPPNLPWYMRERSDPHAFAIQPGDNRLEVGYYATDGARMHSVQIDGSPATALIGSERGHPVYTVDVELPRGQTQTVTLHLTEPAAVGTPIVLDQPLVHPLHVTLHDPSCS